MKLLMCNCKMCRNGRKSSRNQCMIKSRKKSARNQVKINLLKGKFDTLLEKVKIGYTD